MNVSHSGSQSIVLPLAAALVLLVGVDSASAVNRCEGRDGRVTYTDEPCPATARSARRVDDSPPVQVRDAPARTAPDAEPSKDAKASEGKGPPRDTGEAGKATAATVQLQPGRIVATGSPEQEMQRLDELRARQQRQCEEISRRVDYARNDLQSAIGPDRASAELALRRLEEEARMVCPRR
jgi:hypothetical protein